MSRYFFVEVEDKYEGGFRNSIQKIKGVIRIVPITVTSSILDSLQKESSGGGGLR